MRRLTVLVAVVVMLLGLVAGPAAADRPPPFDEPHNHALLIGADVEFLEEPPPGVPPYIIHGFRRCVELAGGQPVPLQAHHDRVHFGRAGEALIGAGHLVVPLGILGFDSCAALEAALPFPPQG